MIPQIPPENKSKNAAAI